MNPHIIRRDYWLVNAWAGLVFGGQLGNRILPRAEQSRKPDRLAVVFLPFVRLDTHRPLAVRLQGLYRIRRRTAEWHPAFTKQMRTMFAVCPWSNKGDDVLHAFRGVTCFVLEVAHE